MKNNKGITLISLVVMIIIILILVTVGTTAGLDVIRQSKYNRAVAEMKVMQTKINEMYEEYRNGYLDATTLGISLDGVSSSLRTKIETAYNSVKQANPSIGELNDFRGYSSNYIKNTLDVDGIEGDYIVNIKTRTAILIKGINSDGVMYYSLCQIETEQFNVEYINPGITYSPDGGMYILPKNITNENNLNMNIELSFQDIPNNMSANDLKIKYSWSTSKEIEPTNWTELDENGTTIAEDGNSNITQAGEYYLWTRVEDEAGNVLNTTISKKYIVKNEYDVNVRISFDANGGIVNTSNKKVISEEQYGVLPTPRREGYTFNGWYTNTIGGTKIESTSIVQADYSNLSEPQIQTIYAQWTPHEYDIMYKDSLPDEYQEVEYIESSTNQYLNTGLALWSTSNWKIENKFSVNEHYDYNNMFGVLGTVDIQNEMWIAKDKKYYIRIGGISKSSIGVIEVDTPYTIIHDNSGNNLMVSIDGGNPKTFKKSNTNLNSIVLYGHREGGKYLKGKTYYLKLWKDGQLLRYFIPCYKTGDNEQNGLYDIINDVFYTNAGTGNFSRGNNTTNKSYVASTQHFKYDIQQNLRTNTNTREGYTFVGWNTEPDGTGTTYTNGASVTNLTAKDNDIIYLYGKWIRNE